MSHRTHELFQIFCCDVFYNFLRSGNTAERYRKGPRFLPESKQRELSSMIHGETALQTFLNINASCWKFSRCGDFCRLLEDGALPKATAKKVAAVLKKPENLQPLKVLAVLRRDIKREFFQANPAAHASQALAPREVILSSWLICDPTNPTNPTNQNKHE